MKSTLYLFACSFFLFSTSFGLWGQNSSIGISAGATIFTQKAEDEDQYYGEPIYKTRLMAQADLSIGIAENFGLKLGIAFEQKGYDRKGVSAYGYAIDEHKFDYLSFPLLAEISFGQRTKVKANAGMSVEYLLKQVWVWELAQDDKRPIVKTDEYARMNYSALVGIGAEFPLSEKLSVELGGRSSIGLKTLQEENSWVKFKHFGFIPFVGLRFDLDN